MVFIDNTEGEIGTGVVIRHVSEEQFTSMDLLTRLLKRYEMQDPNLIWFCRGVKIDENSISSKEKINMLIKNVCLCRILQHGGISIMCNLDMKDTF